MEAIQDLLANYSIESLILLLLVVGIALKFIIDLTSYFYNKLKGHFSKKHEQEHEKDEIFEMLNNIKKKVEENEQSIKKINEKLTTLEEQVDLVTERLQENTRSWIIDKHHYFCFEIGGIDDFNLQSLERRFLYYKAAGGNSYIDGLMEEIRNLPKITIAGIRERINQKIGV